MFTTEFNFNFIGNIAKDVCEMYDGMKRLRHYNNERDTPGLLFYYKDTSRDEDPSRPSNVLMDNSEPIDNSFAQGYLIFDDDAVKIYLARLLFNIIELKEAPTLATLENELNKSKCVYVLKLDKNQKKNLELESNDNIKIVNVLSRGINMIYCIHKKHCPVIAYKDQKSDTMYYYDTFTDTKLDSSDSPRRRNINLDEEKYVQGSILNIIKWPIFPRICDPNHNVKINEQ
jgi:hypothetical protein